MSKCKFGWGGVSKEDYFGAGEHHWFCSLQLTTARFKTKEENRVYAFIEMNTVPG